MQKFIWVSIAVLCAVYGISEGLECYHCFENGQKEAYGSEFVKCNEFNLTASNTWVCPNPSSVCVYQIVDIQSTHTIQTSRTCSNGVTDPCDPSNLPPGLKLLQCSTCNTDRCNLYYSPQKNDSYTFNINANVNLYIRQ